MYYECSCMLSLSTVNGGVRSCSASKQKRCSSCRAFQRMHLTTEYSWKKKFLVFWWFTQQPHLMDIRGNQIVREWQLNTEITNALSHYYSENATEHKIYATRNWAFMNLCHIIICCLKITSLMALWLSYHGIMEHHNISPCGEEKHILRTRLPVESRMHWMHCRTEKNQNTLWKKK